MTPGEMKYLFASFLHEFTPCFKNSSSVHLFILLIITHFYFYGMENDIKKMYNSNKIKNNQVEYTMDNLYSSLQEQRKIGRDSLMKIYGQKSLGDEYLENLAQPLVLLNANEIPPKDSFLLYERKNFPFWVFELVIKGKGHVEIEAEQFSVSPNDIYILPQNRNHMIFSQPDAPWIKRYFLVIGTLPEYLLRSYHLENKFYFPQCKGEYFRHLFDEMIELFQLKSHDMNDHAAGVLLQLIQYLAKHAAGEKPLSAQALKIRHYLDRMLYKKLDLHRMSREIAIPRNRIIKVCKEELRQTPYDYFLMRKIDISKTMLAGKGVLISEVAAKLNFTDQYHFSRIFKEKTGRSPSEFRMEAQRRQETE